MARQAQAPGAILQSGLAALALPAALAPALSAYLDELEKWNGAYNLTAVRDRGEMVTRHLLDSLAMHPHIEGPLLDVGSGAGLPGIPLAIARPELRVTVLDGMRPHLQAVWKYLPTESRRRFLRHAVRALGLANVEVVEARVEDYRPAEPFARVTSRAFASLKDFFALSAHLPAADGQWLAMKGKLDPQETQDLPAGVGIVDIKPLQVPGLAEARHLVVAARKAAAVSA